MRSAHRSTPKDPTPSTQRCRTRSSTPWWRAGRTPSSSPRTTSRLRPDHWQRAQEAGIEVILVDTTVNDESIGASRIASDNFQGGVTAADALAEMIGEAGKVMVISVNPGISSTDARQAGFEEQIATYPDIEYIGTEFSNNEPARAAEILTATLAANPDLNGVFAANLFSAQGTATGLVQAGAQEDVSVVGFDAGAAQVEQLQAGDVQALVVQKPYDIGYQGVEQAIAAVNGDEVTPRSRPTSSWPPPRTSRIPRSTSTSTRRSATDLPLSNRWVSGGPNGPLSTHRLAGARS